MLTCNCSVAKDLIHTVPVVQLHDSLSFEIYPLKWPTFKELKCYLSYNPPKLPALACRSSVNRVSKNSGIHVSQVCGQEQSQLYFLWAYIQSQTGGPSWLTPQNNKTRDENEPGGSLTKILWMEPIKKRSLGSYRGPFCFCRVDPCISREPLLLQRVPLLLKDAFASSEGPFAEVQRFVYELTLNI